MFERGSPLERLLQREAAPHRLPLNRHSPSPRRTSELDADTHLVAAINPGPTRIHENRFGPRGCRGITKYLLLVLCPGVQQIGRIERQLDMGVDRVADRTVEEPRRLLEHRQTDAAIQILREVHGAPVVSEAESDWPLLIQSNEIEGIGGNPFQLVRVDGGTPDGLHPGTERAHTTSGQCAGVDQIGVVYADLIDISVVGLHPQAAQEPGQKVEEGLIGELNTLDLAAILYIDRTQDLHGFRRAVIREGAVEIALTESVMQLLEEQPDRERTGRPEIPFVR